MQNFDENIDRLHTNDMKWHAQAVTSYLNVQIRDDMIPMWIADTDFRCAPCIVDAVKKRAEQGVYGYCRPGADYYQGLKYWYKTEHDWDVERADILEFTNVLQAINVAIRVLSEPEDSVIIQEPVYEPFRGLIQKTGRKTVSNQLINNNGHYEMDYELLKEQVKDPKVKLLILCSPHNPVGRVWQREELEKLEKICRENNVFVLADEIHSDIIYAGHQHIPFGSLSEEAAQNSAVFFAPSKTFNVAGLRMAFAAVKNPEAREKISQFIENYSLAARNTFGIEAVCAAYSKEGREWLNELIPYVEANAAFVDAYFKEHMPQIKMIKPEGTFLCWVDFSGTGMSDKELLKKLIVDSGVVTVPGPWFGNGGTGFMRMNLGMTRENLTIALKRIETMLKGE